MPITIHEIKEHYDHYGLHDMSDLPPGLDTTVS